MDCIVFFLIKLKIVINFDFYDFLKLIFEGCKLLVNVRRKIIIILLDDVIFIIIYSKKIIILFK